MEDDGALADQPDLVIKQQPLPSISIDPRHLLTRDVTNEAPVVFGVGNRNGKAVPYQVRQILKAIDRAAVEEGGKEK